jgi:uncharacterized membrane protein AbrB (regulator of aidB expression)
MNKVLFALIVGGALGIIDGLTAWFTPEVRPMMAQIVIGSTIKGLMTGVLIGGFARKVSSLPLVILFSLAVGGLLSFLVAHTQGKYYLEIILPGSMVGIITGYAAQRYSPAKLPTS